MHRFFIPAELFSTPLITLPADLSRQISRVLRLKIGSEILLLDDRGLEYSAVLQVIDDQGCRVMVQSNRPAEGEPKTQLTLILGLTQREKFEMILQKCTEIGVSTILPVITSRTLIQKTQEVADKQQRWTKILCEAAEQSHRGRIPCLSPIMKYADAVSSFQNNSDVLQVVMWEDEHETGIKPILRNFKGHKVVLIVGPEGGLTSNEVDLAKTCGFLPVSLGKRILRMETAAMVASGIVFYELG